jgi:hypothetical protein
MIEMRLADPETSPAERTFSRAVLKTGLCTGGLLIVVMFAALLAANRCPALEPYAFERNAVSYSLFVLLMLAPVCRFLASPSKMFASSMIAWLMLAAAYELAGLYFGNLFQAVFHTPLQVLAEGTVVYGVLAVGLWLVHMALYARNHPIRSRREFSANSARHAR